MSSAQGRHRRAAARCKCTLARGCSHRARRWLPRRLLTLFHESKSEGLKEQITRTLLERLIVNRPHPWGLLITFIELIKNRYAARKAHMKKRGAHGTSASEL